MHGPNTVSIQHRRTISLIEKDDQFISAQIETGEYGNASEVVRAGLRLLEHEQLKLRVLRQAIAEGDTALGRGAFATYDTPGALGNDLKAKPTLRRSCARK